MIKPWEGLALAFLFGFTALVAVLQYYGVNRFLLGILFVGIPFSLLPALAAADSIRNRILARRAAPKQ